MSRRQSPLRKSQSGRRSGLSRSFAATWSVAAAVAITSGVSAESLAQPRDPALERQAATYVQYREDVAAIEATPFSSAETTREAHRRLSAHDPAALSAGWVAYAALVAAETPEFAAALQNELEPEKKKRPKKGELVGRDAFLARLAADPSYPRKMPGADRAIARVLAMTAQDAARFTTLGEAFKEQAYAMQKTRWGVAKIAASSARLTDADTFARARGPVAPPTLAGAEARGVTAPALASASPAWNADWGATAAAGRVSEPNAEVIIDRILNLAARYSVTGVNDKAVSIYARNDRANQCLGMAQLTLKQCIAATRTPYEEAFCLGEHALNDVADCVGWVAGVEQGS